MSEVRTVTWDQVEPQAQEFFNIWIDGREIEWAEMAWGFLAKAGLTSFANERDKAAVYMRLIVLGVMYREFCTRAWDEWDEPSFSDWLETLNLGAFRVAQLVGSEFEDGGDLTEDELVASAIEHLIEKERPLIFRTLKKHFGGVSMLFASLWATNFEYEPDHEDDDEDDDEGDDEDDDEEFRQPTLQEVLASDEALDLILGHSDDMFDGRLQAFEWVQEGMPAVTFHRSEFDL